LLGCTVGIFFDGDEEITTIDGPTATAAGEALTVDFAASGAADRAEFAAEAGDF
jgi:hypothetical protein